VPERSAARAARLEKLPASGVRGSACSCVAWMRRGRGKPSRNRCRSLSLGDVRRISSLKARDTVADSLRRDEEGDLARRAARGEGQSSPCPRRSSPAGRSWRPILDESCGSPVRARRDVGRPCLGEPVDEIGWTPARASSSSPAAAVGEICAADRFDGGGWILELIGSVPWRGGSSSRSSLGGRSARRPTKKEKKKEKEQGDACPSRARARKRARTPAPRAACHDDRATTLRSVCVNRRSRQPGPRRSGAQRRGGSSGKVRDPDVPGSQIDAGRAAPLAVGRACVGFLRSPHRPTMRRPACTIRGPSPGLARTCLSPPRQLPEPTPARAPRSRSGTRSPPRRLALQLLQLYRRRGRPARSATGAWPSVRAAPVE